MRLEEGVVELDVIRQQRGGAVVRCRLGEFLAEAMYSSYSAAVPSKSIAVPPG
jgi:hypothetical protein